MFPKVFPHLKGLLQFDVSAKDPFKDGKPTGVVVHYTADQDGEGGAAYLASQGLGYHLIIEKDGGIWQMTSFNKKCWHAGKALWEGESPNQSFLSVSLVSWGLLKSFGPDVYVTYSGKNLLPAKVAMRPDNRHGILHPWDAATDAQVSSLESVLRFCMAYGIAPEMICGHDECALPAGRKVDPGGVLPYTMAELRQRLRAGEPIA